MKREQSKLNHLAGGSPTIRRGAFLLSLATCPLSLATVGCATFGPARKPPETVAAGPLLDTTPNPADVVAFLNNNAARVNAIESNDVDIDLKIGNQPFGVSGDLHCQKPRNFRLRAKTMGKGVADIGSNSQEFWSWNGDEKVLYYCSYDALSRGNVALPFPVQPEWVLEVLGMATLNPAGNFSVPGFNARQPGRTFDLVERTTGPGGQPVTKVTVFNNSNTTGRTPQVAGHRLYDGQNRLLCEARILSVHPDQSARVPHEIELRFPAVGQNPAMTMKLKLDKLRVNGVEADVARNPGLYKKPSTQPAYDLARGLPAGPTGLQRTSGWRQ